MGLVVGSSAAAAVIGLAIGLAMGYRAGKQRVKTVMVFPSVREAPLVFEAERLTRCEN